MNTLANINYSISELAKLSGIKQHTIRIWEQRYGILKPKRTDTRIRFYSDEELRLIINISLLNKNGLKISKIAKLSETELEKSVHQLETKEYSKDIVVNQLTKSMIAFDELQFEKIINSAILKFGFATVILDIIYPFLEKIGLLWVTGNINPAQEHFMTNLIRQKIIVAIDGQINYQDTNAKKIMLFLPQHELHELALLFYCFLLKTNKQNVIYLGANLPNADVKTVIDVYKPDIVFSVLTSSLHLKSTTQMFKNTSESYPSIHIVVGGAQASQLKDIKSSNFHIIHSLEEELNFCNNLTLEAKD